jgi:hypothetical protein
MTCRDWIRYCSTDEWRSPIAGDTSTNDEDPRHAVRCPGGGILILLMPRFLNYVVAIYLILVGAIGLNSIYHFIR